MSLLEDEDRKLYSSASSMWYLSLLPVIVAGSLADSPDATSYTRASGAARAPQETEQVDLEQNSEDLERMRMRQDEWAHAELTYGLVRPDSTGVIYVHRMPHSSIALASHSWESCVVGHNWVPDQILSDIARYHDDILIWPVGRYISWWLCRIHRSSMASRNPILSGVNYVLVHGDDFLYTDQRPQGLMELVFGDDQFLFPTLLPRWLNWPILQAFLAPMCPSSHFGISMYGLLDGIRLGHRLVACWSGFFIQVHFEAAPFLLTEL